MVVMEFEDFPTDPRSDVELARRADGWRAGFGLAEGEPVPDIIALIEASAPSFAALAGLEIIRKSNDQMNGAEGYAASKPPRIFLSADTYDGAKAGHPRARMTVAHELAHVVLHPGQAPKARLARGNKTPESIEPQKSAERQARRFAAYFLMPDSLAKRCACTEALAREAGVSMEAARLRLSELGKFRARPEPPFVRDYLAEATARPDPRRWKQPKIDDVQRAWDSQEKIVGEDPSICRACRGYRIARSEYLMRSEYGWYIHADGTVRPHLLDSGY